MDLDLYTMPFHEPQGTETCGDFCRQMQGSLFRSSILRSPEGSSGRSYFTSHVALSQPHTAESYCDIRVPPPAPAA